MLEARTYSVGVVPIEQRHVYRGRWLCVTRSRGGMGPTTQIWWDYCMASGAESGCNSTFCTIRRSDGRVRIYLIHPLSNGSAEPRAHGAQAASGSGEQHENVDPCYLLRQAKEVASPCRFTAAHHMQRRENF